MLPRGARRWVTGLIALGLAGASCSSGKGSTTQPSSGASVSAGTRPTASASPTTPPNPSPSVLAKQSTSPAGPSAAGSAPPASYGVTTKTISGRSNGAVYSATYPQLTGGPQASAINGQIDTAVRLNVTQIASGSPGYGAPGQGLNVIAKAPGFTHLGAHQACALINFSISPEGAAHPTAQISTLVYNLDDARPVTLAAVFTNEQAGLNALAAYVQPRLMSQYGPDYIADGAKPTDANYAAWQATPAGMEIHFQQYQVGPYAIGQPQVTVPWNLLPLSPLGRSILTQ